MERTEITPWFYYDIYKTEKRTIHKPSHALKKVQRFIMRKFLKPHFKQMTTNEAASVHCGKKWIMKLDIKDFFNSITEKQIKDVIKKYVSYDNYDSSITYEHTWEVFSEEQIFSVCTLKGKLPTGASTSPYIANLVLRDFDIEIENFCLRYGVRYTRYMDDLFFSTNREQYFLSLVELEVLRLFKELGFEINVPKIKYISSNKCQQILGLGVNNKKPVLTKDTKREYRAYFYNLLAPIQFNNTEEYKKHEKELFGHLAYIMSVDKKFYYKMVAYIFNIIKRLNIWRKPCLKNLIKKIGNNFETEIEMFRFCSYLK
ncbi:RNA-directed DNA polymerase [bacterium]|nr:RNA-directed DNA polymerase [bacterium]